MHALTLRRAATIGFIAALTLGGCASTTTQAQEKTSATTSSVQVETALTTASLSSSVDTSLLEAEVLDTSDMFTDRDLDPNYDEASATITCSDDGSSVSGSGASVDGGTILISEAGVYVVSGTLTDGQIIVDAADDAKVQIVLSGANITSTSSAALYVRSADKVFVTLATGTTNSLTSSGEYVAIDENTIDAALFSKEDLTINGGGTLSVTSAYGHGIVSKDDLKICGGSLSVEAAKQALSANDSVRIAGGVLSLTSTGDAIHAENTEDSSKGYIYVADGVIMINAEGDAMDASSTTQIEGGTITGSCAKGIKADGDVVILGGTIELTGTDDTVHANGNVGIWGGTLTLSSADDGVHADNQCGIAGGTITIEESYEGLEGLEVLILDGDIEIHSTDDGINAAGGSDSGTTDATAQNNLGLGGFGGAGGMDVFAADEGADLTISGGTIVVYAGSGDGIDSNNTLTVEGGTIYVYGPENDGNSALDYDGEATITGGTIVAFGMSGMAQGFGSSSTQGCALINLSSTVTGALSLVDASGNTLISLGCDKSYNSVVISTSEMEADGTYTLEAGGESVEFTLDGYTYNASGSMMGGMGGMGDMGGTMGGPGNSSDGNAGGPGGMNDMGNAMGGGPGGNRL